MGWLASDSQLLTGLAALRQLPPAAGLALPPHHYAHTHPYTAPGEERGGRGVAVGKASDQTASMKARRGFGGGCKCEPRLKQSKLC